MRKFLGLILGSATIVGFETTFGFSKWRPFNPNPASPKLKGTPASIMPGGITYISSDRIQPLGDGKFWVAI